jgi:class 3 adenylate cyclase
VNLASRLESSVAKPGQIVIARNTYDQVDGEFPAHSLGTFTLRGRQAPVEVFEVDG